MVSLKYASAHTHCTCTPRRRYLASSEDPVKSTRREGPDGVLYVLGEEAHASLTDVGFANEQALD